MAEVRLLQECEIAPGLLTHIMDIYNPVHTPTFASVGFDNFLGKELRGLVGYEIEKLTNQNVLGFPVPTARPRSQFMSPNSVPAQCSPLNRTSVRST